MATRKSSIERVVKVVYDNMDCIICQDVFTDPRVLPCQHTFCLECLMKYGKECKDEQGNDKQPGDDIPCPTCRKEFTIPADGLPGIQKNFFMEEIVNARKDPAEEEAGRDIVSLNYLQTVCRPLLCKLRLRFSYRPKPTFITHQHSPQ